MQNNMPFVRVNFKSFPHLGIWTKENAPFICIEPWHGYSDLFNSSGDITEKEGIIMLEPGKQFSAGFSIEVLN
jgi:galactose mutarotase-like enzyme